MAFVRKIKIVAEHVAEADEVEAAVQLKDGLEAVLAALKAKGFTAIEVTRQPGRTRKAVAAPVAP